MTLLKRAFLVLLLLAPAWVLAAERIVSFHADIDVQADGGMNVTETITIRAEGRDIKRGIYRDLPTTYSDAAGRRITKRLGPWECVACPPGVIHGYINDSLEPVYFQVMLGRGVPGTMGYADDELFENRDAHLAAE